MDSVPARADRWVVSGGEGPSRTTLSVRPPAFPLVALGFILLVTAGWWALALWPLPEDTPGWLARTREVCFGAVNNGLPTPAGWMALILEPVTLIGAVMVVWGRDLRAGLAVLRGWPGGRGMLAGTAATILFGLCLVLLRVAGASASGEAFDPAGGAVVRRAVAAPGLALVDQAGTPFSWDRLNGRPAVIAFVFAHCATVCPTLVNDLQAARGDAATPALVLVTLDPRRDTPPRLAAIAERWRLRPGDFLLGGNVTEVEATVTGWGVPWQRDTLSGEIHHGTQLFVVAPSGRLEWVVTGGAAREAVRLAATYSPPPPGRTPST